MVRERGRDRDWDQMVGRQAKPQTSVGVVAALAKGASEAAQPPVERWQPPYCGDIGLRITADGTWLYQNSPIRRERLVKLFAGILRRESDGRTYLVTPVEKIDVAVEDAPFLAVGMEVRGEGEEQQLVFRTNVDDTVACGPEHPLRFVRQEPGGGLKPYVLVRGRLEALLTRALVYDLAALTVERQEKGPTQIGVWSGGMFFPIDCG